MLNAPLAHHHQQHTPIVKSTFSPYVACPDFTISKDSAGAWKRVPVSYAYSSKVLRVMISPGSREHRTEQGGVTEGQKKKRIVNFKDMWGTSRASISTIALELS